MIRLKRPFCPNPQALVSKNYSHPKNKGALKEASHGKCMYCESKISHIDYAHVEHIKPKAPNKYPESEFIWENLGYSCEICNSRKGSKYDSQTPYLDPYSENPQDHVVFLGWILYPKGGSERGDITIQDIDLNRAELIERRKDHIEKLMLAMKAWQRTSNASLKKAALDSLLEEFAPEKEYSYAAQCALSPHDLGC